MDFKMNRETDNVVVGACITLIVCALSGLLYFMFKRASLSLSQKPFTPDSILVKKKDKKPDVRKNRKNKKTKLSHNSSEGSDKSHPLYCSSGHISEPSLHNLTEDMRSDSNDYSSSADDASHTTETICLNQKHTGALHGISDTSSLRTEHFEEDTFLSELPSSEPTASEGICGAPESNPPVDTTHDSSSAFSFTASTDSVQISCPKTKRPKRRVIKRRSPPADNCVDTLPALCESTVPHTFASAQEVVKTHTTVSETSKINTFVDTQSLVDFQPDIVKLVEQLTASEHMIEELSAKVSLLSQENSRLGQKDEENVLGLHVLQQQYTELLRASKVTEHEKHLLDVKLKNLEETNATLLLRLDQSNAESLRLKEAADVEARSLRDRLTEVQTKLSARSVTPPTPTPELVRAQELAQLVSNENRLLRSTLDQLKSELAQLHQTNRMQQQELQMYQIEEHKFREAQEKALEELRIKHNTEMTEVSTRIAAYETQLKRECQEHELKKQELALELSEARNELSLRKEQEKRLSDIISSLEYQFAELTAEKQHLLEQVDAAKSASESSTAELLIQVAKLTNDLAVTTAELDSSRKRADSAMSQLKCLKAASSKMSDIDVSIDATQPLSDRKTRDLSPSTVENVTELQQLRTELEATRQQLLHAMDEVSFARKQVELANTESECHKATLLSTEKLLAQLQDIAKTSEDHWLCLLADSNLEREKLMTQLQEMQSEIISHKAQIDVQALPSARSQSGYSSSLSMSSLNTKNGSISHDLLDLVDIETDCDIDTVLVGSTSFNTPSTNQNHSYIKSEH